MAASTGSWSACFVIHGAPTTSTPAVGTRGGQADRGLESVQHHSCVAPREEYEILTVFDGDGALPEDGILRKRAVDDPVEVSVRQRLQRVEAAAREERRDDFK